MYLVQTNDNRRQREAYRKKVFHPDCASCIDQCLYSRFTIKVCVYHRACYCVVFVVAGGLLCAMS